MVEIPDWWPSEEPYIVSDCVELMKQLPDNCIDLTVTSPPTSVSMVLP